MKLNIFLICADIIDTVVLSLDIYQTRIQLSLAKHWTGMSSEYECGSSSCHPKDVLVASQHSHRNRQTNVSFRHWCSQYNLKHTNKEMFSNTFSHKI
jgi:hypothetical protein